MTDSKHVALAIIGLVAVIAVVGVVLRFTGSTAQVSYGPGPFIEESAERLCNDIQCQNGQGAVPIGEYKDFWVCGCPEFFADQRIADWSNQWKGDEAHNPVPFPNPDNSFMVRKFREY